LNDLGTAIVSVKDFNGHTLLVGKSQTISYKLAADMVHFDGNLISKPFDKLPTNDDLGKALEDLEVNKAQNFKASD